MQGARQIPLQNLELTYSLNFKTHYKGLMEFTMASWNLSSKFLSSLGTLTNLTPKQRVVIFMVGKSMRLLRTIELITEIGYWPEAEILLRALFETETLLFYILSDDTNQRANKWLNSKNPKERWDWKEIAKEQTKSHHNAYSILSLYPHSHILSVSNYVSVNDGKFSVQKSTLMGEKNNVKAFQVLSGASILNSAICEVGATQFKLPKEWHDEHQKLHELSFFKAQQENVNKISSSEDFLKAKKMFKRIGANFTIVFVHGYTASHLADWYPNISKELDELGIDYRIPDLPGGEHPHVGEWLGKLHSVIKKIDKPLVLVGHSLGTRAILLYLEKYKPHVEDVFLISALRNDVIENVKPERKDKYPSFFTSKIDLEKIKPLVGKFFILHSKDDDSVPFEQGKEIAEGLGADYFIEFEDRKHFSESDNASIVLKVLRTVLRF